MKIAIDLNDVVRDFSNNFVRYYIEGYDHKFDLTDFEFWSHDLSAVFPFKVRMHIIILFTMTMLLNFMENVMFVQES